MTENPFNRTVILANGDRVPLHSAALDFGMLESYLRDPDAEWDPVPLLRKLCLGLELLPEQLRTLREEALVGPDGRPDPVMRSVVLSAVRGEDAVLRLDSPFTDPIDRALSDLLNAQEFLRSHLTASEAEAAIRSNPVDWAVDQLPKPPKWTDRGRRDDPPTDLPPR